MLWGVCEVRVRIYQIDQERDAKHAKFMDKEYLKATLGLDNPDPQWYQEVLNAEIEPCDIEHIFHRFNVGEGHPLFHGHSLSVSDVVVIERGNTPMAVGEILVKDGENTQLNRYSKFLEYVARISELTEMGKDFEAKGMIGLNIPMQPMPEPGAYFCDSIGFQRIEFDESKVEKPDNLLRIVYVEPHKAPYEASLLSGLEHEQKAVGGMIECFYDDCGLQVVANENAKCEGMDGNRRFNGGNSIIAGPFFLVGQKQGEDGGEFCSLTDSEVELALDRFDEIEDISEEETMADTGFTIWSF